MSSEDSEEKASPEQRIVSFRDKLSAYLVYLVLAVTVVGIQVVPKIVEEIKDREQCKAAQKAWEDLDPAWLAAKCEEYPRAKDWLHWSVLSPRRREKTDDWSDVAVDIKNIPAPGWYGMEQMHKRELLEALVFCTAKGWTRLKDYSSVPLAKASLANDNTLDVIFFPPPTPTPLSVEQSSKLQDEARCDALVYDSLWHSFFANTVMKEEGSGAKIYVNSSWRSIPIYQKEKLVEFAGTCRQLRSTYFYDGYSGKQVARYLPVVGVSISSE